MWENRRRVCARGGRVTRVIERSEVLGADQGPEEVDQESECDDSDEDIHGFQSLPQA
jgi:hypothetical protein